MSKIRKLFVKKEPYHKCIKLIAKFNNFVKMTDERQTFRTMVELGPNSVIEALKEATLPRFTMWYGRWSDGIERWENLIPPEKVYLKQEIVVLGKNDLLPVRMMLCKSFYENEELTEFYGKWGVEIIPFEVTQKIGLRNVYFPEESFLERFKKALNRQKTS